MTESHLYGYSSTPVESDINAAIAGLTSQIAFLKERLRDTTMGVTIHLFLKPLIYVNISKKKLGWLKIYVWVIYYNTL